MAFTRKAETQEYVYHHEFEPDQNGQFPATIIAKYDWLTLMYYGCSVESVLDDFGIANYLSDDFFEIYKERYIASSNLGDKLVFKCGPGITLEITAASLAQSLKIYDPMLLEFNQIYNEPLKAFRLDFSGTGLEYLRSLKFDIDSKITNIKFLMDNGANVFCNAPGGGSMKVTRLDVAFDFLNYAGDLYEEIASACKKYEMSPGRCHMGDLFECNTPKKYSVRSGDQRTVYLGSTGSDSLCRVYDKGFQFEMQHAPVSKHPYKTKDGIIPQTWIRIELQLRREKCGDFLYFAQGNFKKGLYFFYHYFAPAEKKGKVCTEIDKYFEFAVIDKIIQNANWQLVSVDIQTRHNSMWERTIRSLAVLVSNYGPESIMSMLINDFYEMQLSDDPNQQRRFSRILFDCMTVDNKLPRYLKRDERGLYTIG